MDSGDNGKLEKKEIIEPLVMTITAKPGEPVQVHFPFLNDKVVTYGFLKVAEKVLDAHYNQKPMIKPANGKMLNFARNVLRR